MYGQLIAMHGPGQPQSRNRRNSPQPEKPYKENNHTMDSGWTGHANVTGNEITEQAAKMPPTCCRRHAPSHTEMSVD